MKKILIIVDYQYDFVAPDGALPVPGADNIWQNIQSKINSNEYEYKIYTFDTHTPVEYNTSDEQKLFPNIHCEFGTKGWNFFNIKPVFNEQFQKTISENSTPFNFVEIENEYFFTKNVFDIWAGNKVYPEWFIDKFDKDNVEIDVCGVALNYCVYMNVMGLVQRGYKVNILSDAVKGIESFPDGTVDTSYDQNMIIMKNRDVKFV